MSNLFFEYFPKSKVFNLDRVIAIGSNCLICLEGNFKQQLKFWQSHCDGNSFFCCLLDHSRANSKHKQFQYAEKFKYNSQLSQFILAYSGSVDPIK